MLRKQFLSFLFLGYLAILNVCGQQTYVIDTVYPVHSLDKVLRVYPDTAAVLTPKKVLKDSSLHYLKGDNLPRLLNIGTIYWGKLTVKAMGSLDGWTLHFEDDRIGTPAWTKSNGKVDVFGFVNDSLIFHKKSGVEYPRKDRDVKTNWVLNQIRLDALPPGEEVQLVIRTEGNAIGYPPYFNLTARSPEQPFYHQIFQFNNAFNIFMFGVTFIIFLYHLLQYFYLKEPVFLWFSIWLLFCTGTQAMTIGLFIGAFTQFRFPVWALIANGVFYSFWLFGRVFINSKEKFPRLDKFILGLALFIIIEIAIVALYAVLFNPQTKATGIGIHYYLLQIYILAGLVVSVILLLKKDVFARYFGFGSIVGSLFLILGTLWATGIIKRPLFSVLIDPFATGIFFQIIIYSFGIAYRQQRLAQQAQEEKVGAQQAKSEMLRIKDLEELKTRFFTNISHEFRTPLTLIQGPLQNAQQRAAQKRESVPIVMDQKEFDVIMRNSSRLQALIDELLELSKLESGKAFLVLTHANIADFLKALVFSFESMATRAGISFSLEISQEQQIAYYDEAKLEKIVYNLLSNAFKYTPEGGQIGVTISFPEDRVLIEVSDSGKGMTSEEVDHIFERFYRVEGSEERGSGIGLTLCKELIELHGGTIRVQSKKGKGTTFTVELPIALEVLEEKTRLSEIGLTPTAASTIENVPEEAMEALQDETNVDHPLALIVEDNPDLRAYIGKIIGTSYQLEFATNGQEGIDKAMITIPDIVISDVMMPEKNGFELCAALKTNLRSSHIPIIMLTAKAGHENKMEGLSHGADAYLTKPFAADELLIRMRNLLMVRSRLWEKIKDTPGILVDDLELTSMDNAFLKKVYGTIEERLDDDSLSVESLAATVGFSRAQFNRKIKALVDKSPQKLITEIRLNKAYTLLKNKTGSVSEIAYAVGYSNLSYFTKSFKDKFGSVPSSISEID